MRCAILFDNLGPYHVARLEAAARTLDLVAIQGGTCSTTYAWEPSADLSCPVFSVNPNGASEELTKNNFVRRLNCLLVDARPEVVFVPGWASTLALTSMLWALKKRIPIVMMSESTPWDEPRVVWKEAIKRSILRDTTAALVGGSVHHDYCLQLGMVSSSIFDGYDTVDNDYFTAKAKAIRSADIQNHFAYHDFFLASCRFVEKKNLFRLVDAYSVHRQRCEDAWDLCLLGDGPLKEELISHCSSVGLEVAMAAPWEKKYSEHKSETKRGRVFMPGFRQIGDLPFFYARAKALVHASTTEQWGLVVNEAMASGLPVIVSERCGCALDLVLEGGTGWKFDPEDVEELTDRLDLVRALSISDYDRMTANTLQHVANWGPDRFAIGAMAAAEYAVTHSNQGRPISTRLFDSMLLKIIAKLVR